MGAEDGYLIEQARDESSRSFRETRSAPGFGGSRSAFMPIELVRNLPPDIEGRRVQGWVGEITLRRKDTGRVSTFVCRMGWKGSNPVENLISKQDLGGFPWIIESFKIYKQ